MVGVRFCAAPPLEKRETAPLWDFSFYRQLASLNEAILVCQLNVPLVAMYSLKYQKVQSSAGSTESAV